MLLELILIDRLVQLFRFELEKIQDKFVFTVHCVGITLVIRLFY